MERRGFLKGLFGGVTAAGVLVAASPREIEAFASPLVKGAPVALDLPSPKAVEFGEHLYNAAGELVAIVTRFNVSQDRIDETSAFGDGPVYVPGLKHISLEADVVAPLNFEAFGRSRLGSSKHR